MINFHYFFRTLKLVVMRYQKRSYCDLWSWSWIKRKYLLTAIWRLLFFVMFNFNYYFYSFLIFCIHLVNTFPVFFLKKFPILAQRKRSETAEVDFKNQLDSALLEIFRDNVLIGMKRKLHCHKSKVNAIYRSKKLKMCTARP